MSAKVSFSTGRVSVIEIKKLQSDPRESPTKPSLGKDEGDFIKKRKTEKGNRRTEVVQVGETCLITVSPSVKRQMEL